jgi:hypothetical protein
LHAGLLAATLPLNVSPLLLIATWEAIDTVLVASAAVRPQQKTSSEHAAAVATCAKARLRISAAFLERHTFTIHPRQDARRSLESATDPTS